MIACVLCERLETPNPKESLFLFAMYVCMYIRAKRHININIKNDVGFAAAWLVLSLIFIAPNFDHPGVFVFDHLDHKPSHIAMVDYGSFNVEVLSILIRGKQPGICLSACVNCESVNCEQG